MSYALIRGGAIAVWPYGFDQLRRDNPGVSFPEVPGDANFADHGAALVQPVDPPDVGEGQGAIEGAPEIVDGVVRQTWVLVDIPPEPKRRVSRRTIVKRLASLNLLEAAEAAIAAADAETRWLWNTADTVGGIDYDDASALALLNAIGADPAVVMAE